MTPLADYDGVSVDDVPDALVLYSDRGFGEFGTPDNMGRVYALRHPEPGRVVLAVDMNLCGTLRQLRVIDCEQVKIPPGIETGDVVATRDASPIGSDPMRFGGRRMSNASINDGAIMLTHCDDGEPALLTARGKDHDLDPAALRELGTACLAVAHRMDHAARGVAPFDVAASEAHEAKHHPMGDAR